MSANLGRQRSRTRLLALLRLLSAAIALLRLSAPSSCHVAHAATFADSAAAAAGRPIAVVNARPFHSEVLSGAMAALAPVADRVAVYMDHYVFKGKDGFRQLVWSYPGLLLRTPQRAAGGEGVPHHRLAFFLSPEASLGYTRWFINATRPESGAGVPVSVRPLVSRVTNAPYPVFYRHLSCSLALLPLFAEDSYYTTKFSSTVLASLTTGTPILADERLLAAYSFLQPAEEHVWLQAPGEGLRTYRGGGGGAEGFGPGSSMNSEETGRMMQMQQQVFELKQRLVESEVQRQARWALAAVAALLLVAAGVLLWAELEAPPLGTMALPPGGVPGLLKEWVGGVWARVVGAWALLVAEGRVAALALAAAAARVVPR
eukprot:XP_001698595.1 predicted protein [Chlamydomonas reinhardtii]